MRIIDVSQKYESKIYVDDQTKLIYKLDCECHDFQFRRIKKIGEFSDAKYFAEPCKHLRPFVQALEKQGYKLKIPEEMIGSDKLTQALRRKLLERANYKCECGCEGKDNLEIHRKTRGSNGGKYNMTNCIVLTHECHKIRHSNEFPSGRSSKSKTQEVKNETNLEGRNQMPEKK